MRAMASAPTDAADTGHALQRMAARTLVWIVVVRGFLFSLYPARPGP